MSKNNANAGTACRKNSPSLLDFVMEALRVTGRIPAEAPHLNVPSHLNRDNLDRLCVERHNGGWVANVTFRNVMPGMGNVLGSPDSCPCASEREAFLAGAAIVCLVVTGSEELPFTISGDDLVVIGR